MDRTSIKNQRWRWRIACLIVTLLALGLRWTYVTEVRVDNPIRGDAGQYVAYAWNLAHHGVFSKSAPGSAEVIADSFRDPGYPGLLASVMLIFKDFGPWYLTVLLLQGLLSALTVGLFTATARPWLGTGASLVAGLLMAVWPHSISMTGFLLSETVTAFWLALGFFLLQRASLQESQLAMICSGLAFGVTAITNAVLIPFGLLVAGVLWARKASSRHLILALALSSLALPLCWSVRNAQLPSTENSTGRALLNAVQGSWPQYHATYIASVMGDPGAARIQSDIQHEYDVLSASLPAGVHLIAQRMQQNPWRYLEWYASKPALLWDWGIRMGQGNIYQYAVNHSPLDDQPVLRAIVAICWELNGIIMYLALAGTVLALRKRANPSALPLALATLAIYVTLIYSLLQSEPRYSIPFKGVELVLAVAATRSGLLWWNTRRRHTSLRAAQTPS